MINSNPVVEMIRKTFPTEPIPSKQEILYNQEPGYIGSFPVEAELAEIREFFAARKWDSVTGHDVFKFRHALSFFSRRALAYFTPAWIVCSLLEAEKVDTAPDDLASILRQSSPNIFTDSQRGAVCEWLNVVAYELNNEDPENLYLRIYKEAMANLRCHYNIKRPEAP